MARIIFISPHQDDVDVFSGGALLHHISRGDAICLLMMTKGDKGGTPQGERLSRRRKQETYNRLQGIRNVEVIWLDYPDLCIPVDARSVASIGAHVVSFRPDCIYLPESEPRWSYYQHPDHLNSGKIGGEAAAQSGIDSLRLRYYHSKGCNLFIDITSYFEESQEALRSYRSQNSWRSPLPFAIFFLKMQRLWRVRRFGRKNGCAYAEGYREASAVPRCPPSETV